MFLLKKSLINFKYFAYSGLLTGLGINYYNKNNTNTVSANSTTLTTDKWHIYSGKHTEELLAAEIDVFSGNSSKILSQKVCNCLGIKEGESVVFIYLYQVEQFNDGETNVRIKETVRDKNIFIIQSTSTPSTKSIMELLLMITATKRANAKTITAVIPYFGYGRSDGALNIHTYQSFGAADISAMLETCGADRIISINLHSGQIQGFFSPRLKVDDINANHIASEFIREKIEMVNPTIIASQPSSVGMAKEFQNSFNSGEKQETRFAMVIETPNDPNVHELIGEVNGRDALIVNDIIDTGTIISETAEVLKRNGCNHIYAYSPHAVLSKDCIEKIGKSKIDKVVITDTIDVKKELSDKFIQFSIAPLLAEVIYCIATKRSVSKALHTEDNRNKD